MHDAADQPVSDDAAGQELSGFADAIAYMARSGGGIRRYRGMPDRLLTLARMALAQFPRAIFARGCQSFLNAAEGANINTLDMSARRLFDEGDLSEAQRAELRLAMDDINHLLASSENFKTLAKTFFAFTHLTKSATSPVLQGGEG